MTTLLLRPDLHLDAGPPAPLLEAWPRYARALPVRVALGARWTLALTETPAGVRWTLGLAGVGVIAGGWAARV